MTPTMDAPSHCFSEEDDYNDDEYVWNHPIVLSLLNELRNARAQLTHAREMCAMLQHQSMQDLRKKRRYCRKKNQLLEVDGCVHAGSSSKKEEQCHITHA
jgi:hypothetical protein